MSDVSRNINHCGTKEYINLTFPDIQSLEKAVDLREDIYNSKCMVENKVRTGSHESHCDYILSNSKQKI